MSSATHDSTLSALGPIATQTSSSPALSVATLPYWTPWCSSDMPGIFLPLRLSSNCSLAWNDFSAGAHLIISFRSSLQSYPLSDVSSSYLIYTGGSLLPLISQSLPHFSAFLFFSTYDCLSYSLFYLYILSIVCLRPP